MKRIRGYEKYHSWRGFDLVDSVAEALQRLAAVGGAADHRLRRPHFLIEGDCVLLLVRLA